MSKQLLEGRKLQEGWEGLCTHYRSAVFLFFVFLCKMFGWKQSRCSGLCSPLPPFRKLQTSSQLSPRQVNKGLKHLVHVYLLLHTLVLTRKDAKKTNREKSTKQKTTSARVRISPSAACCSSPLWEPNMRKRVGLILFPRLSKLKVCGTFRFEFYAHLLQLFLFLSNKHSWFCFPFI